MSEVNPVNAVEVGRCPAGIVELGGGRVPDVPPERDGMDDLRECVHFEEVSEEPVSHSLDEVVLYPACEGVLLLDGHGGQQWPG